MLTKRALGVDKGVQKCLIAARQSHHGLVNRCVTVRVERQRTSDDVGAFGSAACQKSHLVHGVEQLTVSGLEAVDLGNGTRDDDAHDVGHVVFLNGVGNQLRTYGRVFDFFNRFFVFGRLFSHLSLYSLLYIFKTVCAAARIMRL